MNTLALTLLISSAAAFPIPDIEVTDTYDVSMGCARCTATDNQWCSETANFGPYKEIPLVADRPVQSGGAAATMQCCPAGGACTWDDTVGPTAGATDFTCTDPTADPNI